jgi:hypothetical protein
LAGKEYHAYTAYSAVDAAIQITGYGFAYLWCPLCAGLKNRSESLPFNRLIPVKSFGNPGLIHSIRGLFPIL